MQSHPKGGRGHPEFGRNSSRFGRIRPSSGGIDQVWSKPFPTWPRPHICDRISPLFCKLAEHRRMFGRTATVSVAATQLRSTPPRHRHRLVVARALMVGHRAVSLRLWRPGHV